MQIIFRLQSRLGHPETVIFVSAFLDPSSGLAAFRMCGEPPASLLFGYNQDFLLSNIKRMIEVQLIAINAARLSATGSSPLSEQKTVHGRGGGNYLLGMST